MALNILFQKFISTVDRLVLSDIDIGSVEAFTERMLCRRTLLNYARLEGEHWRPEKIFQGAIGGWPGDMIGRTVLALVKLAQITKHGMLYFGWQKIRRINEVTLIRKWCHHDVHLSLISGAKGVLI